MKRLVYGGLSGKMIRNYSARAEVCQTGGMRVVCSLTAAQTMLRLGVSCIRIRNLYGASVETIWNTDTCRDGMTGYNCSRHTVSEVICLPPGEYTADVTFYARNGVDSDTVSCSTNAVKVE